MSVIVVVATTTKHRVAVLRRVGLSRRGSQRRWPRSRPVKPQRRRRRRLRHERRMRQVVRRRVLGRRGDAPVPGSRRAGAPEGRKRAEEARAREDTGSSPRVMRATTRPWRFPSTSVSGARRADGTQSVRNQAARARDRRITVCAHDACRSHRSARFRAGRSHPIAGARAGSHPQASRSRIPRGRSRAALCVAGHRRRLLVRLRISVEAGLAAAASAKAHASSRAREKSARHGHETGRGASTSAGGAPWQAPRRERVGRLFESDNPRAGVAALARIASHCAARKWNQSVPAGLVA